MVVHDSGASRPLVAILAQQSSARGKAESPLSLVLHF